MTGRRPGVRTSTSLWIVQIGDLPAWHLAYPTIDSPDELTVLPYRYETREAAMRALVDSRARRQAITDPPRRR